MSQSNTLSEFIQWGIEKFPANKYMIVLWDHGSGINGFGADRNFNNDNLTPDEIEKGFSDAKEVTTKDFELIGFDACLMSSIEVADRLKSFGNYMVASEELEPPWGWDYSSLLQYLNANPNLNGLSVGKTISDSFMTSSQINSHEARYDAYKSVTMSVVNLTKITPITVNLRNLADYLDSRITNLPSAQSLANSVRSTERYGQSALGSSGLVDIYDLVSKIKEKFPQATNLADKVQSSLKNAIAYKINGEAEPNANGLSIYTPTKLGEFSDSVAYTINSWQRIINKQYSFLKNDLKFPTVQSHISNNTISGLVNVNDISNVTLEILRQNPEYNTVQFYEKDLDPSLVVDKNGTFSYTWNDQIMSLCNEKYCLPTSMNLEFKGDKKFALFPITIQSNRINGPVSLVYEIDKNNIASSFLGAVPEINAKKTISKERWGVYLRDNIYCTILEVPNDIRAYKDATIIHNSTKFLSSISKDYTYGPLEVTENFGPKYSTFNGSYFIYLKFCDYSNNCKSTDGFLFYGSSASASHQYQIDNSLLNANKFFTYEGNSIKINYPSNWNKLQMADNAVWFSSPPENNMDKFLERLSISIYPSNHTSLAYYVNGTINHFVKSLNNFRVLKTTPLTIAGNMASLLVYSYNDSNYSNMGGITTRMSIFTIHDDKVYTLTYAAEPKKFIYYMPTIIKMVSSFEILKTNTTNLSENSEAAENSFLVYDKVERVTHLPM